MPASLGFYLSAFCFGELSRNSPVERGVYWLLVLVHVERRDLQREKNIAEVELGHAGDRLQLLTHAAPAAPA